MHMALMVDTLVVKIAVPVIKLSLINKILQFSRKQRLVRPTTIRQFLNHWILSCLRISQIFQILQPPLQIKKIPLTNQIYSKVVKKSMKDTCHSHSFGLSTTEPHKSQHQVTKRKDKKDMPASFHLLKCRSQAEVRHLRTSMEEVV